MSEQRALYDETQRNLHVAQAAAALPGPDYYQVLRWIYEVVQPGTYIEIGVRAGESLRKHATQRAASAVKAVPNTESAITAALQSRKVCASRKSAATLAN